jgi:hypothetical protein
MFIDLTNYIFEDVKKRIDLGLMWITNNYLNLRRATDKLNKIINVKQDEMDNDAELMVIKTEEEKQSTEAELSAKIHKNEHEYDKTLYTILYSLQNREEPKDL